MDWLKEGDRNSKFFHAVIRERRKKQNIQIALPNGEVTNAAAEIGRIAQDFFADLFCCLSVSDGRKSICPYRTKGAPR